MPRMIRAPFVIFVLLPLSGCNQSNPNEPAACSSQRTIYLPMSPGNRKLDILFLIDNTSVMLGSQTALQQQAAQVLQPLSDLAHWGAFVDVHIGVVTSDYGAGHGGLAGCGPSPGGQMGKLQAVGAGAPVSCRPPVGANFIQYDFLPGKPNNLPVGQDLKQTFACMAAVGHGGCGFQQQLESVRAALHDNLPENAGFLRDEALLIVVFVTGEDDGSAAPDGDIYDKDHPEYGPIDPLYHYARKTRPGVMCGSPPAFPPYGDSGGPLTDCIPAPNAIGTGPGKLYDVSRYIDLFGKSVEQGGIKWGPFDIFLIGVDGPEEPFQVILSDPKTPASMDYKPCAAINEASNPACLPVLQHSCRTHAPLDITGDPAVRLNTVIRSARNHQLLSICDSSQYGSVLESVTKNYFGGHGDSGGGCFPDKLVPDADHPDCVIEDLTQNLDGTISTVQIPPCDATARRPCWHTQKSDACQFFSPDGVSMRVDRDVEVRHTTSQITCAIPCQNPPTQ